MCADILQVLPMFIFNQTVKFIRILPIVNKGFHAAGFGGITFRALPELTHFPNSQFASVANMAMPAPKTSGKGEFIRKESAFRDRVTADGSSGFKAEKGRYHLYVSLACPWAHRTLILRKLKGLEDIISYTVVDWLLGEGGWNFTDQKPKCSLDPIHNAKFLKEIYLKANPDYSGTISVPVLFDKQKCTIVNNESAEIIRMFNTEFNEFCATEEQKKLDFYPEPLREKIEEVNAWIYPGLNNGVYRSGFARTQEAYDKAVREVFEALDKVEGILSKTRFLTGDTITEADVRLFTTLVRFDTVYHGHFKCNKKRIIDHPNVWGYLRDMYQTSCIAETVDQEHIQKHYYASHKSVNPLSIVPIGPDINFMEPHGRENFGQK
ncbi:LOW QUALITY PROTEIN: glutathionyl-hydroquinone reductase YqjG-like [Amphiura filiformis]|uniref:LOW QUALITY PROTEIN: glutathionyl-hydroquinone reductase YqjG-like n=1 Tax=Amphiura filiformis TaxID=82378 RepID=UPI003B2179C1